MPRPRAAPSVEIGSHVVARPGTRHQARIEWFLCLDKREHWGDRRKLRDQLVHPSIVARRKSFGVGMLDFNRGELIEHEKWHQTAIFKVQGQGLGKVRDLVFPWPPPSLRSKTLSPTSLWRIKSSSKLFSTECNVQIAEILSKLVERAAEGTCLREIGKASSKSTGSNPLIELTQTRSTTPWKTMYSYESHKEPYCSRYYNCSSSAPITARDWY